MSDETPALPPPEPLLPQEPLPPPEPAPPPPRPRPKAQSNLVPWIYGLGFVVLIFALLWIWQNPNPSPDALRPSQITDLVNQAENLTIRVEKLEAEESKSVPDALQKQVAALQAQVDRLPKPAPPPNLAPLQQQITALQKDVANQPKSAEPANLAPLEQQVAALAQHVQGITQPNLEPIRTQLEALSHQVADLSQQRGALAQQINTLTQANQQSTKQVAELDQRLTTLQQQSAQVSSALHTAQRMARLNAAQAALNGGQPVGQIDGAPPALAAFADKPPPTEASLRLSFPQAAQAALDASGTQPKGATFGQRVLSRAQSLITIREGTKVIVGDPAAGLLSEAGQRLDAGDLAGAVAAVSELTGPPAQAMASWLAQARSLLAARASLHDLLAHA